MALDRRVALRRAWVLGCVLALGLAPAAFAENPCANGAAPEAPRLAQSDSGLSGTGLSGGDESGMGGTGLSGGDDSGFGGTGFSGGDDSGIGGTGIYGTITAFGSICVNGLRVHYDEQTPVTVDGEPAEAEGLAVGQVVAVEAAGQGSELEATRVSVHRLLVGPITALDLEDQAIEVMDARVELAGAALAFARAAEVGARVEVGGLRRNDGVVVASWLAGVDRDVPDAVSGYAQTRGEMGLQIGGIAIDAPADAFEAGGHVRASGRYDGEARRFRTQVTEPLPLLSLDAARLSVEGYVQQIGPEGRLFLPGIEVDPRSLENARIDRTRPVRVTGRRDASGRLRVQRLQRVERPTIVRDALRTAAPAQPPRVDRPEKPLKPDAKVEKPKRPDRPLRPPKPQPPERPPTVDRPTVIDLQIRDRDMR